MQKERVRPLASEQANSLCVRSAIKEQIAHVPLQGYDYGLLVVFSDQKAEQEVYQPHPLHMAVKAAAGKVLAPNGLLCVDFDSETKSQ